MAGQTFQFGDHLMVRRRGYVHHGIYVHDQRVIDFGGYDLLSKQRNGVRAVTLAEFGSGRKVTVVRHPSLGRIFGPRWLPHPLTSEQIVAESERLAEIGFVGKYTLFGSNCEHVANWCVTGNYFESLQIKRFLQANVAALLVMIFLYRSNHQKTWWRIAMWGLLGVGGLAAYQRERAPYNFWSGVERKPFPPWR